MGALAEPSHLATLNLGSPKLRLPTDVPRGGAALSLPPRNTKKPDSAAASDYDDDDERPHLHHEVPGGSPYLRHLGAVALDPPIHDPRDAGTADAWVERSPTLVRLTGKHPFNGEPPTSELMRHGFITPAPLHYVRNHGAVPKADWASWTVEVTGLVRRPARFTMDELVRDFKPLELPITLACSSGRRKEQNMTRQTLGFHWGPGAVSTSLWRGARLRDVLGRCGVERGAKYVCFEGGDDLPGGGGCRYGTSITCVRAMDPTMDVMLAYMQNGGPVLPDHGFPVRLIVPGYTAGRMVKWLRRIVVTTAESDNYYHHRDNRLFPSHVDAKLAEAEGWWYKPEYVINEMSTNSVITTPANGEVLPINATTAQSSYTVKGFAFSGGGKKVIRVELTLDGGETWLLCSLNHPERPTKYGKHWCWCFWSVDVEVADLLATKEIAVRAWDQTLNTQPENLTWNLMGMMTNCWFRVKINVCRPRKGEIGVSFEHPVQPGPGNQSGGWMARHKNLETTPEPPAAAPTNRWTSSSAASSKSTMKRFTMAEVREHASRDSAWIVVHGRVYDCTNYLKDHPGGADSILLNAGTDCTDEFDAIHSDKAVALLNGYLIGDLVTTGSGTDSPDNNNNKTIVVMKPVPDALSNPREKVPIRLVSKKELSRDVRLLRFALPSSDQLLGLPVGKHLFVCAMIEGKLCMRAYTPTSSPDERGHVDLLVKVYFKNEHPKFPDGGRMTQYLDSLQIGSYVDVKGPLGHVEYLGRGGFMLNGGEKRTARRLAMVAGGSGITPIYQVIQAVLRDQPEDTTVMHLVYANRTEDDILLRDELDRWAAEFPERLKVWYVISQVRRPEKRWRYSVGTVKEDVLREHLPEGGDDTLALACGPPLMIQQAVSPNLEKMKYKSDSVIVF